MFTRDAAEVQAIAAHLVALDQGHAAGKFKSATRFFARRILSSPRVLARRFPTLPGLKQSSFSAGFTGTADAADA
jgi:hypothetical protein